MADFIGWSALEVKNWIHDELHLHEEAECFFQRNIDGPTLLQLTEEDIAYVVAEGIDLATDTSRRLAIKKLIGHIHVLRLPLSDQRPTIVPRVPRLSSAAPPPRATDPMSSRRTPSLTPRTYRKTDILTPRTHRRFATDFPSRASDLGISRSRANLGVKHSEVDSCFGVTKASDSVLGSFPRAPVGQKEMRETPGPSSYFGKYGRQAQRRPAPASFPQAPRNPDFLFETGQISPGVCKYTTPHFDPAKKRGGTIPKASRWGSRGAEITPGPSSYCPRPLALSTFR